VLADESKAQAPVGAIPFSAGDSVTAQVPGGESGEPVFLHDITVRANDGFEGLLFVSMTRPDHEALGT
jgi:hypothetical protein